MIASAILDILLERDAFARFHGGTQLDQWFDDVVKRLHRSYDRDAAKRVIGSLRAAALERRENREAIAERMGRLQDEQGE